MFFFPLLRQSGAFHCTNQRIYSHLVKSETASFGSYLKKKGMVAILPKHKKRQVTSLGCAIQHRRGPTLSREDVLPSDTGGGGALHEIKWCYCSRFSGGIWRVQKPCKHEIALESVFFCSVLMGLNTNPLLHLLKCQKLFVCPADCLKLKRLIQSWKLHRNTF